MLTAHRAQPSCRACRIQLLSLFERGFAGLAKEGGPVARSSILHARWSSSAQGRVGFGNIGSASRGKVVERKAFSTYGRLRESTPREGDATDTVLDIELVVRQARQTFGETLPSNYLSAEEYVLYERLYGPPVRETRAEDLEVFDAEEELLDEPEQRGNNVLLKENEDGEFEEVEFDPEMLRHRYIEENGDVSDSAVAESQSLEGLEATAGHPEDDETIQVQAQNTREAEAILRLQKDIAAVQAQPVEDTEEYMEEEYEEEPEEALEEEEEEGFEDEEDHITVRTHPLTAAARFGTSPSTLQLPQELMIRPVTELLTRVHAKHLKEAAEKAFGGPGLPYSPSTPASKKLLPQRHIGLEAGQHNMSEVEADAYIAGVLPGVYAAAMGTLVETRKRLGGSWIRDLLFREGGEGPRILDAGAGGAGVIAWREILQAEWDVMRSEGIVEEKKVPYGTSTVLTGPLTLRHRISRFLDNTSFLPRLPDYVHSSQGERLMDGAPIQGRKSFDIIIAPHTLLPLREDYRRKTQVQNLWSLLDPNGGVLILIEKGLPRGFEAIAGARSLLLNNHIASPGKDSRRENELQAPGNHVERFREKEKGMIIAPCTNHTTCPMYKIEGISTGRKDFCHFGQRFIRPAYLQRLLGAKTRNHEDVKFSYLAVQRGIDKRATDNILQGETATTAAFEGHEVQDIEPGDEIDALEATPDSFSPLALPRNVLTPLKRRGHVTMDLCTPSGTLERWTVPKSFSSQAYRDARKSKWGDLWALGAKTRTVRNVRLGREYVDKNDEDGKKPRKAKAKGGPMGGIRRAGEGEILRKSRKPRGEGKGKDFYEIQMGDQGMEGIRYLSRGKVDRDERRTKGGRRPGRSKEIKDEEWK